LDRVSGSNILAVDDSATEPAKTAPSEDVAVEASPGHQLHSACVNSDGHYS